jgi:serine/threonine-protein kinase
MLTGYLPEWPFDWPFEGCRRLRQRVHPDMVAVLRRALEISPRKRQRDATVLLTEFRPAKRRSLLRSIQRGN